MLPELALIILLVALVAAIFQFVCIFYSSRWVARLALLQIFAVFSTYVILSFSFVTDDFTVQYVAHSSNSALPWIYKLTAVWSAHEGSLLLWLAVFNAWYLAIYIVAKKNIWPVNLAKYTFIVMGIINFGLLFLQVHTSNPFTRYMLNPPLDGADLNPMLQDLAMIIHPPILYVGYVGTAAAFAITVASLWCDRIDSHWARLIRPWVQMAWIFLTLGIALGSWWAYYELGWGGWWFWDPVENASFMPWLSTTALLHTLACACKHSKFLRLAVFLSIISFALSIFGTFLVRSGIISSVHAFAHDPSRGQLILQLLLCWCGVALGLYIVRWHKMRSDSAWYKNDFAIIINNMLLLVATVSIMLGTIYPLLPFVSAHAQDGVGEAYYNAVFIPIMLIMLMVMLGSFFRRWQLLLVLTLSTVIASVSLWVLFTQVRLFACLAIILAVSLAASAVRTKRIFMLCGHLGLAITIIGISINANYQQEIELAMQIGQEYKFAKRTFKLQNIDVFDGPNYIAYQASIEVGSDYRMYPEKRMFLTRELVMNEVAVEPGIFNDIYVVLGQNISANVWAVRIAIKPFVCWIWAGVLVMVAGGMLEFFSKMYKRHYVHLLCAIRLGI